MTKLIIFKDNYFITNICNYCHISMANDKVEDVEMTTVAKSKS